MTTRPPLHAPGRLSAASLPVLNPRFPRLLAPLDAGRLQLRNRSAISAHFGGWFIDGGLPTPAYADYVEHRCANGVGLFVVGGSVPEYAGGPDWLQNTSDAVVPGYRMLVDAAHRHGAKLFAQLLYIHDDFPAPAGDRVRAGMLAAAPRPPRRRAMPPERSPARLRELAASFGAAAARAAEAGVDGHELHAHEGFLHAQFLSPVWNRRSDAYGGSLANRLRFTLECLAAMRDAVGDAVPLGPPPEGRRRRARRHGRRRLRRGRRPGRAERARGLPLAHRRRRRWAPRPDGPPRRRVARRGGDGEGRDLAAGHARRPHHHAEARGGDARRWNR